MDSPLFQLLFDETERRPLTVTELNAEVRAAVETGFANVWVEGEIVNFTAAGSGHWYFNLNDGTSQIKCVVWKGTNYRVRFKPQNGLLVRLRGRLTFWESKGELKLNVDSLEPAGEGALAAAYEQIRARLESEGLFADELKRPIPFLPRRVAVVTSRTGAAYHDIYSVLARRARSVSILLIPALVQGEGAADSLRAAVAGVNAFNNTLDAKDRIDVMIVGRGGGSAEDLWAFNDETLARAIRASAIPIISAVGHEIDWTICDLISDLRAATPSAAAEIVAGREEDILADLMMAENNIRQMMDYQMLSSVTRAREASAGLPIALLDRLQTARDSFANVGARLSPATLSARAAAIGNSIDVMDQRRLTAMDRTLKSKYEDLNVKMATLDALSPLSVLTRGYSITETAAGEVLRDAAKVAPGDEIKIRLEKGQVRAAVLTSNEN